MHARVYRFALGTAVALTLMFVAKVAEAQALRVVPVPWVATDPTVPHQAYNGHATTFKAIARGGSGSWLVEWDFEGDGIYDFSQPRTNRYDLSTRFTYPDQIVTTTFQARIRVTSGAEVVIGTYPVRVFADVPTDPNAATDRQLQVMRGVAVDDGLWFLHTQMTRTGNEEDPLTGAQISGTLPGSAAGGSIPTAAAGFLWALSLNGHYAAFPTAYIGEMRDPADNAARFANDPYAEDATRVINYLLTQTIVLGIDAASEANTVGFYPEVQREPIYGTDDGIGLWVGDGGSALMYPMGHITSAFSVANLSGYVAQVGDPTRVLGRRFEHILQQYVDGLVFAQAESGVVGSWYYTPNSVNDDLSTGLWGMTGLWHADEYASNQGVIVPNLVKTRLIDYLRGNANNCPAGGTGGSYTNAAVNVCDFTISAGHTLALGWVGANTFSAADTRVAFPGYSATTRGQLRALYNSSLTFIGNTFLTGANGQNGVWNSGFVEAGNFGRVDGLGNHYAMLHWQDAARAVEPEVASFGGHNWARAFSRYLINNQNSTGSWNWALSGTLGQHSDNGAGASARAEWAILVLSPDAIPPLAIGTASVTSAPEGTTISFNGSASDPGTGNPTYAWDFDNGDTLPGQNVTYAFPDNGVYDVTLTSTSIGGTSVDTIRMTISNVAPVAAAGPDLVANEGDSIPFNVTFTDPGSDDTHTFGWSFGDTGTAAIQGPSHAYADNGTFNVTATVTDDDGGVGSDPVSVQINNVAPVITSTPGTTAVEGQQYTYTLTFTDPGGADTQTCSAPVRPAGSALVGCQLVWTPDFSQAVGAAAPVRMCVTDDDGGQTCQDYTITVSFLDQDGDGLPDSWEISNFGNITSQDEFGDPDGDGMNNLQEFNNVTDPLTYDGPNTATTVGPVCGSEIPSLQTTLVAGNASDPQGAPLLYSFQLFSDVGLTILVAEENGIPQGAGITTSWAVPVNLLENTRYYWRVRARDQFTFGAWSTPICSFFVNTVNEAPTAPGINTPAFGSQVDQLRPDLTIDNASDPDEDVLTYTFEVYRDPALSILVASQTGRPSGAGSTTTWTVNADLIEDTTYHWRARATDPDNLSGGWSGIGAFFVTTVNAPPESPVLVAPLDATVVDTLRPDLMILNADDADFDALVYDWQLSADDTFATILESDDDVAPQGDVTTVFTLAADLEENQRYCWRARSDDGQATSSYSTACFLASAINDPPAVPTLMNPGDDTVVATVSPTFTWAPATDPEGQLVTYDVEVMNADDDVVATALGVSGTVTAMGEAMVDGEDYSWHVRAVDSDGESSQYAVSNRFAVVLPESEGGGAELVVNGGGCSAGGGASAGGIALLGLGLIAGLRRRRRRD